MNDCVRLSDQMPDVAHGRTKWTPADLRHLSGCAACQREWELVRAVRGLGEGLIPAIDAEGIAQVILRRLEDTKVRAARRRRWTVAGLAAAAGVGAVLWSSNPQPATQLWPRTVVAGLEIPLPELDGLQPAELDSVLRHMDDPSAVDPAPENGELSDLESEELEKVLESWEG